MSKVEKITLRFQQVIGHCSIAPLIAKWLRKAMIRFYGSTSRYYGLLTKENY